VSASDWGSSSVSVLFSATEKEMPRRDAFLSSFSRVPGVGGCCHDRKEKVQ